MNEEKKERGSKSGEITKKRFHSETVTNSEESSLPDESSSVQLSKKQRRTIDLSSSEDGDGAMLDLSEEDSSSETNIKEDSSGSEDSSESRGEDYLRSPALPGSDTSSPSSQESSSLTSESPGSSDTEIQATKMKALFVMSSVDPNDYSIHFFLNTGQRPETLLEGQGDHVTSYVAIILAILQSAGDTGIRHAIDNMRHLSSKLLGYSLDISVREDHEPDFRKDTNDLLKTVKIPKETRRKLIAALKYKKVSLLAKALADMTARILVALQQQSQTTVFSRGRIGKSTSEGADGKQAAYGLIALDRLCNIIGMSNEQYFEALPDILNSLSTLRRYSAETADDHALRYGLKVLIGSYQLIDTFLTENTELGSFAEKAFFDGEESLTRIEIERLKESRDWFENIKSNILENQIGNVAIQMGHLFDYQYELTFDLTRAFPEIKINWQCKKEIEKLKNKLKLQFPAPIHDVLTLLENRSIAVVRRLGISELLYTIQKHFSILELAFPSLYRDKIAISEIQANFLKKEILEKSGWCHHQDFAGHSSAEALQILQQKLASVMNESLSPFLQDNIQSITDNPHSFMPKITLESEELASTTITSSLTSDSEGNTP